MDTCSPLMKSANQVRRGGSRCPGQDRHRKAVRGGAAWHNGIQTARGGSVQTFSPRISASGACVRTEPMWLVHLALSLAAIYAAVLTAMYLAQTGLLFPTALVGGAPVQLPASTPRLQVRTPDGEVLVGVRIQATGEKAERAPTLLGFGGNAWNAEAMALHLHGLFPDREVAAFHYRGYGPSGGRPSAEALLSDSVLVFDHLRRAHARECVVAI